MDQEREDYADPQPPPSPPLWFQSATHRGTIAVVCGVVLLVLALVAYLRYSAGR